MSNDLEKQIKGELSWIQSRIDINEQESGRLAKMAEEMYRNYQNNKFSQQPSDPILATINSQLLSLTTTMHLVLNYLKLLGMKAGVPYKESEDQDEVKK